MTPIHSVRAHLLVLVGSGFVLAGLPCGVEAEDAPRLPDMRQVLSYLVQQRWPAPAGPNPSALKQSALDLQNVDPEVVTLPAILVNAPVLRTPSKEDTVRAVVGAIRSVNYTEYVARDTKRQHEMHDLLDLAGLARLQGEPGVADKLRRETYRALTRDPSPLERAMDRSANGGRY